MVQYAASHDLANDYFADGLTDKLIRHVSIIDGLSPRSRTSSFAFKGKPLNVREAGKQLAADYILEGSVLWAGQHGIRLAWKPTTSTFEYAMCIFRVAVAKKY